MRLSMKSKYSIFNFTCSKNLLTRQRAINLGAKDEEIALMLSPLASLASEPYAIEENGKKITHVLSPLASLASEPYVIEENGKEIAHVLSPLASLASEPYVIEENGKEIASVLSTRACSRV